MAVRPTLQWKGFTQFSKAVKGLEAAVQDSVAREAMAIAEDLRDQALENFTVYDIGMVTGRSRALLVAKPGVGMRKRGKSFNLAVVVGYPEWPEMGDALSGGKPVPFYPYDLNYGNSKMAARPYWSAAVDAIVSHYRRRMETAVDRAIAANSRLNGGR